MAGIFYGIGVGPGDPELLTFKAVRLLGEVDSVAVPVTGSDKKSTAFRIAERFISPSCGLIEIDFPMTYDRERLTMAWEEACRVVGAALDREESVAFLTLGDPMLYSTYIYIYDRLQLAGYTACTIPGINSFSAAAAAAGVPLTFGDEKMAILSGASVIELNPVVIDSFETIAVFKVAGCYKKVIGVLEKAGRLDGSLLVVNCGQSEERIVRDLKSVIEDKLSYFSLIISRKEPLLR